MISAVNKSESKSISLSRPPDVTSQKPVFFLNCVLFFLGSLSCRKEWEEMSGINMMHFGFSIIQSSVFRDGESSFISRDIFIYYNHIILLTSSINSWMYWLHHITPDNLHLYWRLASVLHWWDKTLDSTAIRFWSLSCCVCMSVCMYVYGYICMVTVHSLSWLCFDSIHTDCISCQCKPLDHWWAQVRYEWSKNRNK